MADEGAVTIASDDPSAAASNQILAAACTTHKGKTAGWITCTGDGTVRVVIDCKAPQITDYTGPWTTFSGSVTVGGECNFGINFVYAQSK